MNRESANQDMTVVVIPTRNRPLLAMYAIQSCLSPPVDGLQVIVSDNSTIESDRRALSEFCKQCPASRLHYIVPPQPFSMAKHWDWAMHRALRLPNVGYVIYLTDRSVFKPGELAGIVTLARKYPDRVISYDWVTIFDQWSPITVERQPQTGQIIEVSTARLLFLSSRSIFPRCLPRIMNCSVPRSVIEKLQRRFGNVFASISPDYNFAYRCLELLDGILFYDHAVYVSYAMHRSNGAGGLGIPTEASKDFLACLKLEGRRRNYAAPVPAFETGINYIVHEYCLLQRESTGHKFPRLRGARYLVRNVAALLTVVAYKLPLSVLGLLASLRTRMRKVVRLQWPTIAAYETSPEFESVADAINYVINVPPDKGESAPHLDFLRE